MRQYDSSNLIVHPVQPGEHGDPDVIVEVTPQQAGWDYVHLQVRRLAAGQSWSAATGETELALVLLGGSVGVRSDRGEWVHVGERESVFAGLPYALYLPRRTSFTVSAETACEVAVARAPTDQDREPRLVTPQDVGIDVRGGDNVTRQINNIIPPGFPCHRLVVVEAYTPGGNWSSYPPHKHDVHKSDEAGRVLEADLEEVYYYKLDRPEGFAFQRIYTTDESPLQRAGNPIDAVLLARNDDIVLVPEGYHPVTAAPGYTTYYLNVLAGSAQSLANTEDPRYAWVKEGYRARDPRVPIYDVSRAGHGAAGAGR
jgi:5-deoxy-glucuronate isomerase